MLLQSCDQFRFAAKIADQGLDSSAGSKLLIRFHRMVRPWPTPKREAIAGSVVAFLVLGRQPSRVVVHGPLPVPRPTQWPVERDGRTTSFEPGRRHGAPGFFASRQIADDPDSAPRRVRGGQRKFSLWVNRHSGSRCGSHRFEIIELFQTCSGSQRPSPVLAALDETWDEGRGPVRLKHHCYHCNASHRDRWGL